MRGDAQTLMAAWDARLHEAFVEAGGGAEPGEDEEEREEEVKKRRCDARGHLPSHFVCFW